MKKVFRIVACILAAVVLIAAGYLAYVLIAYHRLGDQVITPEGAASSPQADGAYTLVSYNAGFGAYEADYGFFMDGGDQAWAWSKKRLDKNLQNMAALLQEKQAQFYLIQEVDIDSTRSYHVDERPYFTSALGGMAFTFAQNYDSPFLFYPFLQPHGASKSGLLTFSAYPISEAKRVELPVETGFTKFLDLDRCYAKNRISLADHRELVLYNFHLSAYTSDGKIANEQLKLLLADMQEEFRQGHYCIAGGDFNKDVLGNSSAIFGTPETEYTWAQPIPEELFAGMPVSLIAPIDRENPVPSCRNADSAYHPGQYVVTVDGFLVTENVEVLESTVLDTGFAYSDHNPVLMRFTLKTE